MAITYMPGEHFELHPFCTCILVKRVDTHVCAVQDIISKLLHKVPSERLGAKLGAEEVMRHPFFADIDFTMLRHQKPPYIPPQPQSANAHSHHPDF